MSKAEDVLFVADTYNHKIKKVDISTNTVLTINTSGVKLSEPAGLCISADGKKLYVADTNNHDIKIVEFDSNYSIVKIDKLELKLNTKKRISKIDKSKLQVVLGKPVFVNSKGGKLIVTASLNFTDGLGLTSDAPQSWIAHLPSASWSCVPNSDSNVLNFDVVISVPPMDVDNAAVEFVYNLVTCTSDSCFPRSFVIQQPVNFSTNAPLSQNVSLKVILDQSKVTIELLNKY